MFRMNLTISDNKVLLILTTAIRYVVASRPRKCFSKELGTMLESFNAKRKKRIGWLCYLSYLFMYSHSQWLFYEFVSKITNKVVKQSLRVTVYEKTIRTKTCHKVSQMCRPDLFPRACKFPNLPARFISTRMYMRKTWLKTSV